ncbi:MAG: hypothetical protein HEEMFOPI_01800 [Holosporales bacterium]
MKYSELIPIIKSLTHVRHISIEVLLKNISNHEDLSSEKIAEKIIEIGKKTRSSKQQNSCCTIV